MMSPARARSPGVQELRLLCTAIVHLVASANGSLDVSCRRAPLLLIDGEELSNRAVSPDMSEELLFVLDSQ